MDLDQKKSDLGVHCLLKRLFFKNISADDKSITTFVWHFKG